MARIKNRYGIAVLLLVLAAIVVANLEGNYSQSKESGLENIGNVPMCLNDKWQGQDFPLEEFVYDILETRAVIHRSYTNETGKNVFLSIVHYAETKVDFHSPEACLGGQGLKTVKTTKKIDIKSGEGTKKLKVARIITIRNSNQSFSYYFYKAGGYIGSNYIKMRLSIAANKLMNNDTRGSLIRISTTFEPGKESEAESVLLRFAQDLFPYITLAL